MNDQLDWWPANDLALCVRRRDCPSVQRQEQLAVDAMSSMMSSVMSSMMPTGSVHVSLGSHFLADSCYHCGEKVEIIGRPPVF